MSGFPTSPLAPPTRLSCTTHSTPEVLVCPRRCGCCFMDSALTGTTALKEQLLADHLFSCRADSTQDPSQLPDHLKPVTGAQEDNVFRKPVADPEEDHVFVRSGWSNLIERDEDGVYIGRCPRGCGATFAVDTEEGRAAYANHLMGAVEGRAVADGFFHVVEFAHRVQTQLRGRTPK